MARLLVWSAPGVEAICCRLMTLCVVEECWPAVCSSDGLGMRLIETHSHAQNDAWACACNGRAARMRKLPELPARMCPSATTRAKLWLSSDSYMRAAY